MLENNAHSEDEIHIRISRVFFEMFFGILIGFLSGLLVDFMFSRKCGNPTKVVQLFYIISQLMVGGLVLFIILVTLTKIGAFNQSIHEGIIAFTITVTVFFVVQTQLSNRLNEVLSVLKINDMILKTTKT